MAEEKQAIAEEALDIVEDQIEVVVESVSLLKRIVWNHKTHVSVAFMVGAGVGGGVAYKVTKDKLTKTFELLLDEEIEKTKEAYSRKYMTGDYASPEAAAKKLIPEGENEFVEEDADEVAQKGHAAFQVYKGGGEGVVGEPETAEEAEALIEEEVKRSKRKNVFENSAEEFDWEEETAKRLALADTEPYVITFEEHMEDNDFDSMSLTYYEGDNVLADESDEVVHDVDGTVGEENLRFGYGSKDGNVVYIRNPRTETNMEVVRSEGSYSAEVLGFGDDDDAELKHAQRRPRKFRESDE